MLANFRVLFFLILVVVSCRKATTFKTVTAQDVINKAIDVSGGNRISNSTLMFNFRGQKYKAFRRFGNYQFERCFIDKNDTIIDLLDNNNFERFRSFKKLELTDSTKRKYSKKVNSVHYFAVLPYGLNDEAVNKKYIDTVRIKGKKYHKIEVTFNKEKGGDDFEDVFLYWINTKSFKLDYLAYQYHTNRGGKRFREAYNERIIDSVRFVDYNNYKPINKEVSLYNLDRLFDEKQLKLVSKIELDSIIVK